MLKSSETARKLKEEIEEESDDFENEEDNRLETENIDFQDNSDNRKINKLKTLDSKRPTFKAIGFKILLGRKALNHMDEFSKMIIKDVEKNLMKEYFEIDDKMFQNRFMQLFSKYVCILKKNSFLYLNF